MKKMLVSFATLASLLAAPVFASTDVTQGYSSTLQPVSARVKNAIRPQAAMLSTVRSLDIKIVNVTGQPIYAMLFPAHDPYNPIINDAVGHLVVDHMHHNDITDNSHIVIQNASRTINILDQAICRYAVITVYGTNYNQFVIDDNDCRRPIG